MEHLRQQNGQEKSLSKMVGAENTLLGSEKRKKLEKGNKKNNIIKYVKNQFKNN